MTKTNEKIRSLKGGFREELTEVLRALERKEVFFALLFVWLALFQFLGNSTFGYFNTPSLLQWMYNCYAAKDSEDSHGLLIPFLVFGLLWWKRERLLSTPRNIWPPALLILGFSAMLHIAGYLIQQPRVSIVALFVGIYALVGLIWGWQLMKAIFFPYVLFIFSMPIGSLADPITLPLRMLATKITVVITHGILGLNVQQQGTQLFDPNGAYAYDVAVACSGIRSLISLIALTSIFGC